jgi:UPF0755 protein
MVRSTKKAATKGKRIIKLIMLVLLIAGLAFAYIFYQKVYKSNVSVGDNENGYFYLYSNWDFKEVVKQLHDQRLIEDEESFIWLAKKLHYGKKIYPGRYKLKNGMSNRELINMLRSGQQEPIKLTFNNARTKEILAGKIARQIEPDSIDMLKAICDESLIGRYGFNKQNIAAMFIPNTYQLYWNLSSTEILERMQNEYKKFWNDKRIAKAKDAGLTKLEVSIIASIIEEETQKNDEKPIIAGVYINRLKKGMKLEADPTVKFALGDFDIKRVLKRHLTYDSPYNTYMYAGLPPGPICVPSVSSIDAVLNYQHHQYIYFCAREDFSGYHNFARTKEQHDINARKYQQALNKKRIF